MLRGCQQQEKTVTCSACPHWSVLCFCAQNHTLLLGREDEILWICSFTFLLFLGNFFNQGKSAFTDFHVQRKKERCFLTRHYCSEAVNPPRVRQDAIMCPSVTYINFRELCSRSHICFWHYALAVYLSTNNWQWNPILHRASTFRPGNGRWWWWWWGCSGCRAWKARGRQSCS